MQKQKMSWQTFDLLTDQIAKNYKDKGIKKIVGLTRGGLPLAVKLSNMLNIPMEALHFQTRDGDRQDITTLLKLARTYKKHELLFVDDICDSGKTILEIRKFYSDPMFTVLVSKIPELVDYTPETKFECENKWVVFPWEI